MPRQTRYQTCVIIKSRRDVARHKIFDCGIFTYTCVMAATEKRELYSQEYAGKHSYVDLNYHEHAYAWHAGAPLGLVIVKASDIRLAEDIFILPPLSFSCSPRWLVIKTLPLPAALRAHFSQACLFGDRLGLPSWSDRY